MVLNDDKEQVLVGRNHDLLLFRSHSEEGEVILGVSDVVLQGDQCHERPNEPSSQVQTLVESREWA